MDLLLWPDTVDAFYADRACSPRSAATGTTWGFTYANCNACMRAKPSAFTTDDLVAFVTQRGRDTTQWSSATALNYPREVAPFFRTGGVAR